MGKTRMNALDLACAIKELQHLIGTRLQNVYDVTQQMYALKFTRGEVKETVIVESGIRIHSTRFNRDKPKVPSGFTMKLRKHIRNWRLEGMTIVSRDRIVDLTFGIGEAAQHLILELYAKGNVILTDASYQIVALLRTHKEEDVRYAVHEMYPIATIAQSVPTMEKLTAVLKDVAQQQSTVKMALTSCTSCGPSVVEHVLIGAAVRPNTKVSSVTDVVEFLSLVGTPLLEAENMMLAPPVGKGILVRKGAAASQYEDFSPLLLRQFTSEEWDVEMHPSFNAAVDVFFAALETKKVETAEIAKDKTVESKKDRFLREHQRRVAELEANEALKERTAMLITQYVPEIEDVLTILRGAISRGMPWEELARVIRVRQREGHPTANLIHRLALERNCVELLLSDKTEDEDEAEPSAPVTVVEIDIDLSAYANSRRYYDMKKVHHQKLEKTKAAEGKAAASTEKKSKRTAEKIVVKKEPQQCRPVFWYEKFQWFITTNGFHVIAGRDAQQNDLLVKRYLRRGDIFLHVDLPDAPCGIVKNPACHAIPLRTLEEGGSMVVCRSSAWESRTVISAWWAHYHQVTRTTESEPSAQPFTIRGKKNYLSPKPLAMAMTLMFHLSADSPSVVAPKPVQALGDGDDATEILPTDPAMDDSGPLGARQGSDTLSIPPPPGDFLQGAEAEERPLTNNTTPSSTPPQQPKKSAATAKSRRPTRKPEMSDDSSEVVSGKTSSVGTPTPPTKPDATPSPTMPSHTKSGEKAAGASTLHPPHAAMRKAKLKKIQRKYADQDDEDRERAMQLLGNPLSKAQQNEKNIRARVSVGVSEPCSNDLGEHNLEGSDDVTESVSAPKQQRKERVRFLDPNADVAPPRQPSEALMDETAFLAKMHEEMEQSRLLTGTPTSQDTILYAIPMCAPLPTLHHHRYCIKLTPGVERKGRSAKMVQSAFATLADDIAGEKSALQRCKEEEFIGVILGATKVHSLSRGHVPELGAATSAEVEATHPRQKAHPHQRESHDRAPPRERSPRRALVGTS